MTDDIWSVSSLANAVKRSIESGYGEVRVKGEVGKVTRHGSGHIYFDLKDDSAVLHGAWFGAVRLSASKALETGAEVIVRGRLTTYPARSEYQIIASGVELAGVGALLKLIEERKKKLAAEGLFDEDRKKPLPFLPRRIGVITSPTGAVVHDIMHRLQDRFMPHVLLWPVKVQGDDAAESVTRAIMGFNAAPPELRPDVIIVARGGGSVEDLMPFNDEALVRAVAASAIPVISAVGHETDWTLIDLVADKRAPTPTGAAEMAVPVMADLVFTLRTLSTRLDQAPSRLLQNSRLTLDHSWRGMIKPETLVQMAWQRVDEKALALRHALNNVIQARHMRLARLVLKHPRERVEQERLRLAALIGKMEHQVRALLHRDQMMLARLVPLLPREKIAQSHTRLTAQTRALAQAVRPYVDKREQRLTALGQMLETLSYRSTLARGYAVARDANGKLLQSAAQTPAEFAVQFVDGDVQVKKV